MTSAFERFKDSYFRHPNRDGPDLAVLDMLDNSERKEAENLLLDALTADDTYSIQALGYLRSQQAFALLVELLPKAEGVAKVYIAEALWRIRRYEPALLMLCQILKKHSFFRSNEGRVEATIALGKIDEKSSLEALRVVRNDREYLVSYHARRSLAALLGVQEKYEALAQVIMTGTPQEQKRAMEEQHRLVENALANYDK